MRDRRRTLLREIIRDYLILFSIIILMALIAFSMLGYVSVSAHAKSPEALSELVLVLESTGHSFVDLIEVTAGALIGALAVSLFSSKKVKRREGQSFEQVVTDTHVHALPAGTAEEDAIQIITSEEKPGEIAESDPSDQGFERELPYYLRTYFLLLALICVATMFLFTIYGVISMRISPENLPNEEIFNTILFTYSGFAHSFIDLLEVVVGGLIGALSASLNQIVSGE